MRIKIVPNPSEFPRNLPITDLRKGASIANEAAISLGGAGRGLWIINTIINPVIIATRDNPIRNDLIPSCFQLCAAVNVDMIQCHMKCFCEFSQILCGHENCNEDNGMHQFTLLSPPEFSLWLFYGQFYIFQIVVNKNFHKQWAELWPGVGRSYK